MNRDLLTQLVIIAASISFGAITGATAAVIRISRRNEHPKKGNQ